MSGELIAEKIGGIFGTVIIPMLLGLFIWDKFIRKKTDTKSKEDKK